jgi:putative membrane protein
VTGRPDGASGPSSGPGAGPSADRARDHLANERTFLAWVRTALAFVALGAALAGFAGLGHDRRVAAACLTFATGVVVLGYGSVRYARVRRALDSGAFPPASRGPVVLAAGVTLAAVAVLVLMVTSRG